jgi:hypothetical protein
MILGCAQFLAKIHKPIDTRMRSSGEVIISGKEFYTRRQDIAKIVSIPEIFITKIEKHESLEFTTNSTTLVSLPILAWQVERPAYNLLSICLLLV